MPERRALLIGVSRYAALPPLDSVLTDIERLREVISDPRAGDFRTAVLDDPDHEGVVWSLHELFADADVNDVLLLHFSGHGMVDPSGDVYLAASDTHPSRVDSTAVKVADLWQLVHESRSRHVILLLDVRWSGGDPRRAKDQLEGLQLPHAAVLASSPAGDSAGESSFTRSLAEGLRRRQTDVNGDGRIDVSELHAYVGGQLRPPNPLTHRLRAAEAPLVVAGQLALPVARAAGAGAAPPDTDRGVGVIGQLDRQVRRADFLRIDWLDDSAGSDREPPRPSDTTSRPTNSGPPVPDPAPGDRAQDAPGDRVQERKPRMPVRRVAAFAAGLADFFGERTIRPTDRAVRDEEPAWDRLERLLSAKYTDPRGGTD